LYLLFKGERPQLVSAAYKPATIALAVIAGISIVSNVLLVIYIYLLRKTLTKGWFM